ncbi:MAG: hypothetical protein PHD46_02275, partial [Eubacteriales bacterium]|nr:hypothetical protein [Eubacteriales bacterium]
MKKHKKIIVFILTMLVASVFSSCERIKSYLPATEDAEQKDAGFIESRENELFAYDVYNDYIAITKYKSKEPNVVIPAEIDEKPVTTIASLAFHKNEIPVRITLPRTLTTIKSSGFYCCTKLEELI